MFATRTSAGTVTALLETADGLLAEELGGGGPLTPVARDRGAAYALRIALEVAVEAALTAEEAGLGRISTRAKLLCLRHYAGPELARRVNALWRRLSAGCKYHHDEMGPTHAQVRAWRASVQILVADLAAPRASLHFPQQAGTERLPAETTMAAHDGQRT